MKFGDSAFRQQVQKDMLYNHMNLEEFGLIVNWNGTDTLCALHATAHSDSIAGGVGSVGQQSPESDNVQDYTLVFRRTEMPIDPVVNSRVTIDGEFWDITKVVPEVSHVLITVKRFIA